jgi:two-component system sensor histidine kinase VicK
MNRDKQSILVQMTDLTEEVYFIYNIEQRCFEHVNNAFTAITKIDTAVLFNNPHSLLGIIHKEDQGYINEKIADLIKTQDSSMLQFRIVRADNQLRWIRLKIYPIIEEGKILYLSGIGEDDSIRRASLLNMEKVVAWKNASLEIVSHDLRGPIGAMKMLASIIDKKLPDHPEIHKLTAMIGEIANRNIDLIQVLLSKESLESSEVQISRERLDVVWEIDSALEMYIKAQKNIQKQITFTHSHDQIYAELDSMKFVQIINNLVSNAIKFTGENGQINIHLEQLEKSILVTVQDDGIGIPKKMQPVLFKKYTEAGRVGLAGEESVGLGMWIIKSLVDEHKGTIWFETQERIGTTFYVELPLIV